MLAVRHTVHSIDAERDSKTSGMGKSVVNLLACGCDAVSKIPQIRNSRDAVLVSRSGEVHGFSDLGVGGNGGDNGGRLRCNRVVDNLDQPYGMWRLIADRELISQHCRRLVRIKRVNQAIVIVGGKP